VRMSVCGTWIFDPGAPTTFSIFWAHHHSSVPLHRFSDASAYVCEQYEPIHITLTSLWQDCDTSSWRSYELVSSLSRSLWLLEEVTSVSRENELGRPSRPVEMVSWARQARDKSCHVTVMWVGLNVTTWVHDTTL